MNTDDAYKKVQDEHGIRGAILHLVALAELNGPDESFRILLVRDLLCPESNPQDQPPTPEDEPPTTALPDDVARLLADAEETLNQLWRGVAGRTNFDIVAKAAVQVGMAYVRATANR